MCAGIPINQERVRGDGIASLAQLVVMAGCRSVFEESLFFQASPVLIAQEKGVVSMKVGLRIRVLHFFAGG